MKPPSTLNGHLGELRRPRGAKFLNYEGELAVIVGAQMKGVGPDDVLDYVMDSRPPTTWACTTSATPTAARCCG